MKSLDHVVKGRLLRRYYRKKKEEMMVIVFFTAFPTMFSTNLNTEVLLVITLNLSSANIFNFGILCLLVKSLLNSSHYICSHHNAELPVQYLRLSLSKYLIFL